MGHISRSTCEAEGREGCEVFLPSFQPRKCDAPHQVPDDEDVVFAEQCDGCGASEYVVERAPNRRPARVKCTGCGHRYVVAERRGCEVVWA